MYYIILLFEDDIKYDIIINNHVTIIIIINNHVKIIIGAHHKTPYIYTSIHIIDSVDSISRDERDTPLTQYITNAGISRARYTITHFKHHHRVLRLISNRMSVYITLL